MKQFLKQDNICSEIIRFVCELYVPEEKSTYQNIDKCLIFKWALTDSNRRPSACKDACLQFVCANNQQDKTTYFSFARNLQYHSYF